MQGKTAASQEQAGREKREKKNRPCLSQKIEATPSSSSLSEQEQSVQIEGRRKGWLHQMSQTLCVTKSPLDRTSKSSNRSDIANWGIQRRRSKETR